MYPKFAFLAALTAAAACGQSGLADASLEQLLNTPVTSVSKKEEKLARTAASVFVINQDDIRRSGAENIPDLLRMVPGVEVAQINNNSWAVSIRGFNQLYSNKVLVLVDGRSVYSPVFSGVFWDQIDMPLEVIERIEVIRGPGASVWGANAVNGVINIITKSAKAAKGGVASATASTEGDASGMSGYGGDLGSSGAYRAFAKYSEVAGSEQSDGAPSHDSWSRLHAGFRSDWDPSASDALTVQGELFSNRESQSLYRFPFLESSETPYTQALDVAGGNLLARWTHTWANGSDFSLQTYYDQFQRNDVQQPIRERTLDVDFQHHLAVGSRQDIVWGLGYRSQEMNLPPGYEVPATPPVRTDGLYSAFFQDEIEVASAVWLTLGSKFEHNAYTGFEYEPSARIAWAPDTKQTLWASASKAIRQPSLAETGMATELGQIPLGPGLVAAVQLLPNPHFRSEQIRDYETGYRRQLKKTLSLDADVFLSYYRDLATYEPQALVFVPGPAPGFEIPFTTGNKGHAIDYGGELSLNWAVNSRWRISPGYSLVHIDYWLDPSSGDTTSLSLAGDSPRNMVQARSSINVSRRLEWDQSVYWSQAFPNGLVSGHTRVDSRLAWKLSESVELSLTGQNLLRRQFSEFGDGVNGQFNVGSPVQRSLIGKIAWRF
jgi:iron complex outermembrane recepter protein